MSMFATLTTDETIADERDSIGSGGPLESGLYKSTISMAYATKSKGGALGIVLHLKTDAGREVRQTLWVTSGTEKGCKNYYEKDGERHYLPGFNLANSLALLTVGTELSGVDTETKVVPVYSPEAKAEVPTKVEVLMPLLNQEIIAGIIKQTVDKNIKNDAGVYVPSGETRDENEIDKFFRASDRKTTAEIRAQAEEARFIEMWDQRWTGKTRDRSKGTTGNAGVAGAPAKQAPAKKPTTSLFAA